MHVVCLCCLLPGVLFQYRGVWLLLVSGSATLVAWTWYMLFLAYEVSRSGRPEDAAGAASRGTLRQYFCGQWQWILLMANGCIIGGYFIRSFRILKVSLLLLVAAYRALTSCAKSAHIHLQVVFVRRLLWPDLS